MSKQIKDAALRLQDHLKDKGMVVGHGFSIGIAAPDDRLARLFCHNEVRREDSPGKGDEQVKGLFIDFTPDFKPGDPKPSGYVAWHRWAEVQAKAGIQNRHCPICCKWYFDTEDCGHPKEQRMTQRQVTAMERRVERELQSQGLLPRRKR